MTLILLSILILGIVVFKKISKKMNELNKFTNPTGINEVFDILKKFGK